MSVARKGHLTKGWFPLSRNVSVRTHAGKIYARKWNRGEVWKATRKSESWARFNFYVYAWPSLHCLYFIYARSHGKIRRSWKSTPTNLRPTVRLFYPHSLHDCSVSGVFKATQKGKKSKEGFEVTPGNRTRDPTLRSCLIAIPHWEQVRCLLIVIMNIRAAYGQLVKTPSKPLS